MVEHSDVGFHDAEGGPVFLSFFFSLFYDMCFFFFSAFKKFTYMFPKVIDKYFFFALRIAFNTFPLLF